MDSEYARAIFRRFAAPLSDCLAGHTSHDAGTLAKSLWTAMIAGPQMEEKTWDAFHHIADVDEITVVLIQRCYREQMRPLVTDEELAELRRRYNLQRQGQ